MSDMARWSYCLSDKSYIDRVERRCLWILHADISNINALFESVIERHILRCFLLRTSTRVYNYGVIVCKLCRDFQYLKPTGENRRESDRLRSMACILAYFPTVS
jgi:hypothetical protein